jgi:fructoselysine-6-P-deglycase FrlB-like protein
MATKCADAKEVKRIITAIIKDAEQKGGIKHIFCIACGGSLGCFYPMNYLLKQEAKAITCDSMSSNEFVHATPKSLGPQSVVFAMSLGGGTKETVEAAKVAKENGAIVVALCAGHGVPLEQYSDYSVIYRIELDNIYAEVNQSIILNLAFEMLNQTEGYEFYEEAIDGILKIPEFCEIAAKKARTRAIAWGEAMKDEPIIYTLASGPSTLVAYIQTICMFMEMEWVNSGWIHTGEYFHGPFEITDQDRAFLLFMSVGRTRILDERALKFLKRYAKKVEVLDAKEMGIEIVSDKVVEYFNPIIHWVAGLEYAEGLAKAKRHPLMMRRYLGKVEY